MKPDRQHEATTARETWETPEIEALGRITDLVQGDGKVDTQDDMDPTNTAKPGAG